VHILSDHDYIDIVRCRDELRAQILKTEEYARMTDEGFAATMGLIATLVEIRDAYTFGHSLRVSTLSCALAKRLGFHDDVVKNLGEACLMHDIGKVRTPDAVLLKADRLTSEEAAIMRRHPEDGAEVLHRIPTFRKYLPIILYHHERHDGLGYPAGLKGDKIPSAARLVAVADAYDAMTTRRPYRDAMSKEAACEEVLACLGSQFNPEAGGAFVEMIRAGSA
jgi:putative nucleotidyltransferase with HDIG domain